MKKFEEMTFFLLLNSTKLIKDKLSNKFKEEDVNISIEQFLLLQLIKNADGIMQQELADTLGKDKTTMVRMIDAMEKKNLVKRVKTKENIRAKLIFITEFGSNQLPKAEKILSEINNEINNSIGSKKSSLLKSILKGILNIEEQQSLF